MAGNELILFESQDKSISLNVPLRNDSVWLNRNQMAELFDRDVKTIGKHVNNAIREELGGHSVVAKFATTAADGKTYMVDYYDLDVIISVGYRVKSQRDYELPEQQIGMSKLADEIFRIFRFLWVEDRAEH